MKLDVCRGVFGKYIVVAYNRVATTVIDFASRAMVAITTLLALQRSPTGFRGVRTSVYLLRLVARTLRGTFVTIALIVISIVRGECREYSFSNLLVFFRKDLLYKYVKVVEYLLLLQFVIPDLLFIVVVVGSYLYSYTEYRKCLLEISLLVFGLLDLYNAIVTSFLEYLVLFLQLLNRVLQGVSKRRNHLFVALVNSVLLGILITLVPPFEVGVLDVSGLVFYIIELVDIQRERLIYRFLELYNLVRCLELLVTSLSIFPQGKIVILIALVGQIVNYKGYRSISQPLAVLEVGYFRALQLFGILSIERALGIDISLYAKRFCRIAEVSLLSSPFGLVLELELIQGTYSILREYKRVDKICRGVRWRGE